jgi:ornithine cyclodeaminase
MNTEKSPTVIDAPAVAAALSPADAVAAVTAALTDPRTAFDPATDLPRRTAHTDHGHFLLMPSEVGGFAGVKVATVAPENPAQGLPRIQGTYLLHDARTLSPLAVIDGGALTTLRTPAVSAAAVLPTLRLLNRPLNLVVFGAGPQGVAHVETFAAALDKPFASVRFVVRHPDRAGEAARALGPVLATDSQETLDALAAADLIICATTADTPLFQTNQVRDDVVVVAVGSHEPNTRELDAGFLAGATVIVEDVETALETAGDIVLANFEGAVNRGDLTPLREALTGPAVAPGRRPVVFKSVGMSWEDLVVAEAVYRRLS